MARKLEVREVERGRAPSPAQIPENPVTTGEKIKFYRITAGYTQDVTAGRLGVGAALVKHWEGDEEPGPRLEQLKTMARLFSTHFDGVTPVAPVAVADLIGEDPEDAMRGFTRSDLEEFIRVQRVYIAYANTLTDPSVVSGVRAALDWAQAVLQDGEYDPEE